MLGSEYPLSLITISLLAFHENAGKTLTSKALGNIHPFLLAWHSVLGNIFLERIPKSIGSQQPLYCEKYFDLLKEITNFLLLDGFYGLYLDGWSCFMWQDRVRRIEN